MSCSFFDVRCRQVQPFENLELGSVGEFLIVAIIEGGLKMNDVPHQEPSAEPECSIRASRLQPGDFALAAASLSRESRTAQSSSKGVTLLEIRIPSDTSPAKS